MDMVFRQHYLKHTLQGFHRKIPFLVSSTAEFISK